VKRGNAAQRVPEFLMGRRKYLKTLEYEVKWVGCGEEDNSWLTLEQLQEMGEFVLIAQMDEEIRSKKSGADRRKLHTKEIVAHLADFGLSRAVSVGRAIQLSGGQRSRLVLAAVMWACPHVLVLDEPTNYLDLVALAALSRAITRFKGGVIMVSHHEEFVSSLCRDTWRVPGDGKVYMIKADPKEEA